MPAIHDATIHSNVAAQALTSTFGREPLDAQSPAAQARPNTAASIAPPSNAATSETFDALDASSGISTPTWIHAGAHTAEAGYQDPALGWIGVRALSDSSGIHATLVPGSSDAAQSIGSHLAGLNSYLTAHHTPVQSLTMSAQEGFTAPTGDGQQERQNPGQGTQQRDESQTANTVQRQTAFAAKPAPTQSAGYSSVQPGYLSGLSGSGHSISVMA